MGHTRKEEVKHFGRCVVELPFTPEPNLLQNTEVEKCCFLLLGCSLESVWSDVAASFLEGFLGIVAESGVSLAALKACELLSILMLACSGAIVVCFREISSVE